MVEPTACPVPRALTIAGSDSGGGAGIQADLKTFTALGVYGMTALTGITAQNTLGVHGVWPLAPEAVAAQVDAVATDLGVDAAKTGMLAHEAIIEAVADRIRAHGIERLVVDPVMVAKGGHPLLAPEARRAVVRLLLPLALVVTPNIPEAEVLTGRPIRSLEAMQEAARRLVEEAGARVAVVKGGHLAGGESIDVYYDGRTLERLSVPRVETRHTHGTGCTFSAAIAAELARGTAIPEAVARAKDFVTRAIASAPGLGKGYGPTSHLFAIGGPTNRPR